MKRCLAQGAERFELLVGAAVLANKSHEDRRVVDQTRNAPSQTNQQIISSADRHRGEKIVARTRAPSDATNPSHRAYTKKIRGKERQNRSPASHLCPIHRHNCNATSQFL